MNMKVLGGIVAIIIIGASAYFIWGRGSGGYGPVNMVPIGGGQNSLQQLVAAGNPVTCTFSTTTAAGTESGTVFIANGMVAGDFTASSAAGGIEAHMIMRDSTNYTWTSASTQGFKTTISTGTTPTSGTNQGVDYGAQMNYACQAWNADSGKFNLPANISFMSAADFTPPTTPPASGATGAGAGASVQGNAAQCAQCDSLPSAQKAQCLAALHC